jgi:hypothetical protein
MKARPLTGLLNFRGDRPGLVLRDHETGHISVHKGSEHVATAGPGSLLALQQEAYLMSICGNHEIRGSWYAVARALSILQQTNDWDEAYAEAQSVTDFEAEYGI